jgi:hypothetical protein
MILLTSRSPWSLVVDSGRQSLNESPARRGRALFLPTAEGPEVREGDYPARARYPLSVRTDAAVETRITLDVISASR